MRVLERELRHAIERREIEVRYQPVFGGETSRIAGVEGLVRWRHPTRGTVSPAEFIPVAEELASIVSWAAGFWKPPAVTPCRGLTICGLP
jgi:EAL domain-containing protein (putative c-di-GMP-specific phosphodiesterase class I)